MQRFWCLTLLELLPPYIWKCVLVLIQPSWTEFSGTCQKHCFWKQSLRKEREVSFMYCPLARGLFFVKKIKSLFWKFIVSHTVFPGLHFCQPYLFAIPLFCSYKYIFQKLKVKSKAHIRHNLKLFYNILQKSFIKQPGIQPR